MPAPCPELAAARARGDKFYETGKPCAKGHICKRYVSSQACYECHKANKSRWCRENPEKARANRLGWVSANYDRWLARVCAYSKARWRDDIPHKLRLSLRIRVWKVLKLGRIGSAVDALGCTVNQLKAHIESKFHSGMTWENWGPVWQLDHVRALASYDLTDPKQFAEACHYTNLQPLLLDDHWAKSAQDRALLR